ncbi:helix-turn-helix transcriptional regulator [Clostridium sp.]|uniref:helix-turn-helix domain-containing protein n=1 Tax=Clostridium sp. TaxID=1506 RepID=UPI00283CB32C|nr:helix-turn-helix transcriptional regulator [Clostridium sp.]MDR3596805.1 helix-turn-helix transcriptional regulator [Clostridium sp.]
MLKEMRKKKGLTQKELGEKIRKHKSYISRLENSQLINVSIEIIIKLAQELDADKTEIFLFFANAYIKKIETIEKEQNNILS